MRPLQLCKWLLYFVTLCKSAKTNFVSQSTGLSGSGPDVSPGTGRSPVVGIPSLFMEQRKPDQG